MERVNIEELQLSFESSAKYALGTLLNSRAPSPHPLIAKLNKIGYYME